MNINEQVESYELHQNIAQGCLTNSKHPDRFINGVYPQVVSHGHGCHLYDLEARKYIDFICGLGTNLFGYNNPKLKKALTRYQNVGHCHSLPSKWEIIAARKIKECWPWVEKVKFLNDGSSACSAAIRMARTYQAYFNASDYKTTILSDGYHGWHDEFTSLTPPACGVKESIYIKKYEGIQKIQPKRVGAIIIEPVVLDDSTQRIEELQELKTFCTQNDILLIFDETITALRYPRLSVSNAFNITPDLIIFGKALANGEKISCVAGKSAVMEGQYFVSGTFHGHAPSLIASALCLHLVKYDQEYDVSRLVEEGIWFMEEFNKICKDVISLKGYGSRGVFQGSEMQKAIFFQEMCKANILFGPSFFLNWDHFPHLKDVLYIAERVVQKIKTGDVVLEGQIPTSPFANKARGL